MAHPQINLIWADAVSQYNKTTGINLHDAQSPKPQSAEELLNLLDRRQSNFSEFRSKRAKMFKVLSGALTPIESLGKIASGYASTVWPASGSGLPVTADTSCQAFPPSSLIFGAVTYLIDVRISLLCLPRALRGVFGTADAVDPTKGRAWHECRI